MIIEVRLFFFRVLPNFNGDEYKIGTYPALNPNFLALNKKSCSSLPKKNAFTLKPPIFS